MEGMSNYCMLYDLSYAWQKLYCWHPKEDLKDCCYKFHSFQITLAFLPHFFQCQKGPTKELGEIFWSMDVILNDDSVGYPKGNKDGILDGVVDGVVIVIPAWNYVWWKHK